MKPILLHDCTGIQLDNMTPGDRKAAGMFGARLATGAYFHVLEAGDFRQVRKMTLVK